MEFHVTPFQDAVKELVSGKYQMAFVGQGGVPSGLCGTDSALGKGAAEHQL